MNELKMVNKRFGIILILVSFLMILHLFSEQYFSFMFSSLFYDLTFFVTIAFLIAGIVLFVKPVKEQKKEVKVQTVEKEPEYKVEYID